MKSRYSLLAVISLMGAWGLGGCTSSPVLPPAASVSRPGNPPAVGRLPPSVPAIPTRSGNPWKPLVAARSWKYIVIHHTATATGSVESIHESHLKNKDKNGNHWLGVGYHFVIGNGNGMPDGAIEPTFRWRTQIQGAHAGSSNKDYNEIGIGVCLVGNFEKTPPTAAQRRSVRQLVQTLKSEYGIASMHVVGHKDIRATSTECPGKLFPMSEIAADQPSLLIGSLPNDAPREPLATARRDNLR